MSALTISMSHLDAQLSRDEPISLPIDSEPNGVVFAAKTSSVPSSDPCTPIIVNAGLVYFAPNAIGRRSGFFGP
jgi:hypothetical protein